MDITEFPEILPPISRTRTSITTRRWKAALIQLRLTFLDEKGDLPICRADNRCIWQFNFWEFELWKDMFTSDSIKLLKQNRVNFEWNNRRGINDSTLWRLVHVFRDRAERQHPLSDFPQDAIFVHLLKLLTVPESAKAGRVLQLDQYVLPDPVRHIIIWWGSPTASMDGSTSSQSCWKWRVSGYAIRWESDSHLTSRTFRKLKENFISGSPDK